jgi:hypothetical protein
MELNPNTTYSKKIKYSFNNNDFLLFYSDFQYSLELIEKNENLIILKSKYLSKDRMLNYTLENDSLSRNGYLVYINRKY